ncbi:DEAD/DEAH box helicase [Micromonospora chalcea]|uniref:DEAD/DEAH box helicase n=1 Tax=Micromonospora chalcea TaxID=1874 RepID=UPI0023786578|nr:DEAD/DEAH box helicase [Micromonospora chalcea]WDQ00012.1 DEAD/DEAH box helicase [Micromonospora chalcea]
MRGHEAHTRFVRWLDERVTAEGRGDHTETLDVDPAGVFWLGRLAPESAAIARPGRERRMDPCAIGIRLRPATAGPWAFTVRISACGWYQIANGEGKTPSNKWAKTEVIEVEVPITMELGLREQSFGAEKITARLREVGIAASAEIRVSDESWRDASPELTVEFVNTTGENKGPRGERYLFQTQMTIFDLPTAPYTLESLPDSFRYDRSLTAIGINCGVNSDDPNSHILTTADTVVIERKRPEYTFDGTAPHRLDLGFHTLATDPIPQLTALTLAYEEWGKQHWSDDTLTRRATTGGWSAEMLAEAREAAGHHRAEVERVRRGVAILGENDVLRRAFQLMNEAMARAARGRYHGWRPFQIGFILSVLPSLTDGPSEWDTVEIVWFATGGGKTETYLGLLILAAFFDRLRGKRSGITAWSRFPLRMLSLQQTQRFADALGAAEVVRQDHAIKGHPISLGYFIGASSTPNDIPKQPTEYNPIDVEDDAMPKRYKVLSRCSICAEQTVEVRFNRRVWRLEHFCANPACRTKGEPLPIYVVDAEIYRFLPTVVIGTLDKASVIGMQASMRGFVHGPTAWCTRDGHGFTYAKRGSRKGGCLVPDCDAVTTPITEEQRARFAPSFRLQDELHLLRDSLGAVDSHYEAILDGLQRELTGTSPKIIASSATLEGYERQVDVLYSRPGRVFPQPGPQAGQSFWSRETDQLLRRFVAVWPRGVTLEWVSDRTTTILQDSVRRLISARDATCTEIGIDPTFADELLNLYGTDVIYGNTVRDVEAARRSMGTQVPIDPLRVASLTGQTNFADVRDVLDDLLSPEDEFAERIHVVTASSMLSHGVDVDRLNIMTVLGVPLTTAEFIQATARVGRTYPGLVYVIHKVGRERDSTVYSHFRAFVEQGDRFVEPIPVTRSSRRVLELTTPAAVEARRLFVHEPKSPRQRLTTVDLLRDYVNLTGLSPQAEVDAVAATLGIRDTEHLLREDLEVDLLEGYFVRLQEYGTGARWPTDLLGRNRKPMLSLRDVEARIPISDD